MRQTHTHTHTHTHTRSHAYTHNVMTCMALQYQPNAHDSRALAHRETEMASPRSFI
jgi:hypothetical protein